MTAPTLKIYRVTSPGTTYYNNLSRWNVDTTTPQGTWIGAGASSPNTWLDSGTDLAGQWSQPVPLIFQFDGGTAEQLSIRLYNSVSNLEDFVADSWGFSLLLTSNYIDPTTITAGTLATWASLPIGALVAGYDIDGNQPNPANDGTTNLLVPHNSVANRWISNFYIYMALKSSVNAVAGQQTGYSYRVNWVYP